MGKIVEKKKKKKGRPSLLDLQKRSLKQQQQEEQQLQTHQNTKRSTSTPQTPPNYNSATAGSLRRSTRRNPHPSPEHDEDEEEQSAGKRREKKLRLVLKLPSQQKSPVNSDSHGSDSNPEENNAEPGHKKRKINAIGDGSGSGGGEKAERSVAGTTPTRAQLDSGPSTPLPDKKLLLFILDRLQKKDTYGVYSEPVDPKELPDYHEVIEHPMDFGTIRKKLANGAYSNLEQFEKDVFLICSNAMQYNAPDTIYFRQARSIQELAIKNFENLRQDSDDNEPEPKVIRRGRPPTKNFKKLGRPSLDRAGSEFSSGATLASGGESIVGSNHDMRKGPITSDKSMLVDSSGKLHSSRNDVYTGWLAENRFERSDEGSMLKGHTMKHGKKLFVLDENRRNTYKQFHPAAGGREPSVLATFEGERKQLVAVGVYSEHGYARSLARFAANLGPIAWKIASKKIESCLPAGLKFGRGWVGENDIPAQRPLLSFPPGHPSSLWPFSVPQHLGSVTSASISEWKGNKSSERLEGDSLSERHVPQVHSISDSNLGKSISPSAAGSSSILVTSTSIEPCTGKAKANDGLNSQAGFNLMSNSPGAIRPRPPFQNHGSPLIHPAMNGLNGAYGFNLPAQVGKLIGAIRPPGCSQSSQVLEPVSRTNTNFVNPAAANTKSYDPKFTETHTLPNSGCEALPTSRSGTHPQASWQGMSAHQKQDSRFSPQKKQDQVPPDLNIKFQSPGSPTSSRVDSTQPDLALQL